MYVKLGRVVAKILYGVWLVMIKGLVEGQLQEGTEDNTEISWQFQVGTEDNA